MGDLEFAGSISGCYMLSSNDPKQAVHTPLSIKGGDALKLEIYCGSGRKY